MRLRYSIPATQHCVAMAKIVRNRKESKPHLVGLGSILSSQTRLFDFSWHNKTSASIHATTDGRSISQQLGGCGNNEFPSCINDQIFELGA